MKPIHSKKNEDTKKRIKIKRRKRNRRERELPIVLMWTPVIEKWWQREVPESGRGMEVVVENPVEEALLKKNRLPKTWNWEKGKKCAPEILQTRKNFSKCFPRKWRSQIPVQTSPQN